MADLKELQSLAIAARTKQKRNEKLTAKEKRDIQRYADAVDDQKRQEHYARVPKKHLTQLTGRQYKLLDDAHRMYGIPCNGPEVNLYALLKWLFDFIAKHGRKLKEESEDDRSRRRLRDANHTLKFLEIARLRKELIPRSEAHTAMAMVAAHVRSAGSALQERFGRDALDILSQHLVAAEAEIQARLTSDETETELP